MNQWVTRRLAGGPTLSAMAIVSGFGLILISHVFDSEPSGAVSSSVPLLIRDPVLTKLASLLDACDMPHPHLCASGLIHSFGPAYHAGLDLVGRCPRY